MDDMKKTMETINEKTLNALLEYASASYVDYLAQEFMEDEEGDEEIIIPSGFDERMKKFIDECMQKERRKSANRKIRKILVRAAIILLTFGCSLGLLTTVSQAAKVKVYNFIIDARDKFTSIHFGEKEGNNKDIGVRGIPSSWHNVYIPTYVPDDFEILNTEDLGLIKIIEYKNSRGETITFEVSPVESDKTQLDTENAKIEETVINGNEGMLIEKKGYVTLVWHDNTNVFCLSAQLDKRTALNMAESVKRIN